MGRFIKRFLEWLPILEKIDGGTHIPPPFNEGEIWWCYIGENVGTEISGKGIKFSRPVLVLRKLDGISFLGVPLLSKNKTGPWYATISLDRNRKTAVFLAQIRYMDYRRIDNLLMIVEKSEFEEVQRRFLTLLAGNILRPPSEEERADVGKSQDMC